VAARAAAAAGAFTSLGLLSERDGAPLTLLAALAGIEGAPEGLSLRSTEADGEGAADLLRG